MHVSWLNVPVPVADVAVHDVQVMGVTFVLSPAHPNPIKFGRIWTAPASLLHDSTPGNGAASEVVVGGTVVVGLAVVVGRCVVEEVVVETARVFDVKLSVVVGPGNLWDDAGIGDRPLGKRGCSW